MIGWYMDVLRKYTVFHGRAGRPEFWWFTLVNIVVSVVIFQIVIGAIAGHAVGEALSGLYGLAVLLPNLGVAIRRLHDTNRTGWWILIGIIPVIGWIILIVFYAMGGDSSENSYGGLPPTEPGQAVSY
jgi:uncharacterized membrane protein YhaH (DUF805 family)